MAYTATNTGYGFSLSQRIGAIAARVALAWSNSRHYRNTLAELEALSERELSDLGLCRADLAQVAHDSVYGK